MASFSRRGDLIEELRDRRDKLGRGKWLLQQDAVRDALGRPIVGRSAGHVDHGKRRLSFSNLSGQVPAAERAHKVHVRNKRPILFHSALKESQSYRFNRRMHRPIAPDVTRAEAEH